MTQTASLLVSAYDAAVAACDPRRAVEDAISCTDGVISIGSERFEGISAADVVVVAIGKAASAMVRGVVSVLGPVRGLAVSNHEESCPVPLMVGSHPVPDGASVACGEALLSFVEALDPDDLVIYLVSGGGSSIAVAPTDGVPIDDLADLNRVLMVAGIPIGEMNEVRASVSRLKGGGLAAACMARRSITLVLSDVVGEGPSHVASGPTLGAGMGSEAADVVTRYRIGAAIPESVMAAIRDFSPGRGPDEPFVVVGSPEVAARAAARYIATQGIACSIATTQLEGEASTEATEFLHDAESGMVTIATGETTVTVAGDGVGGRNQEAALAAAIDIAGSTTVFLACGTDGIDGPTPAAGAVVDGGTATRAAALSLDLEDALSRNDSYPTLSALDAVVIRGDSGTNVADIWMVAKDIASIPPG
jgi:glycerate-2-kinase